MFASCDTFVVLPSATTNGRMIFGKNSDRPRGEVQEIVFVAGQKFPSGAQQKCTYISIDTVPTTYSTILSKPGWMWGAEMGSNEHGLCVGNEAVWTRLASDSDSDKKLLGMDLVRLALERARTADEAVTVITELLAKYGQGGPCSDTQPDLIYHNGFLLVDPQEAWVLETAGTEWAAEKVDHVPYRNISNCLSIGTKIDRQSATLKQTAIDRGLWDGKGEFDFAKVYSDVGQGDEERLKAGSGLLQVETKDNNFNVKSMIRVLRDKPSRICRPCSDAFPTASSQVSLLAPTKCVHWFTGTPDASFSYFKPFIFHPTVVEASDKTKCPEVSTGPDSSSAPGPDFPDRRHTLYRRHEQFYERLQSDTDLQQTLRQIENLCIDELEQVLASSSSSESTSADEANEIHCLFSDSVESELRFYR